MYCSGCGTPVRPGARFCCECGMAIGAWLAPMEPRRTGSNPQWVGGLAGFGAAMVLLGGMTIAWSMGARGASPVSGDRAEFSPTSGPVRLDPLTPAHSQASPFAVAIPTHPRGPDLPTVAPSPSAGLSSNLAPTVAPATSSALPLTAVPPANPSSVRPLQQVNAVDFDMPPSHVVARHVDELPRLQPLASAFQPPPPAPIQIASVNPVLPPISASLSRNAAPESDAPAPRPARRLPMRYRADAWRLTGLGVYGYRQAMSRAMSQAMVIEDNCHPSRSRFICGGQQTFPMNQGMGGFPMNQAMRGSPMNRSAPVAAFRNRSGG